MEQSTPQQQPVPLKQEPSKFYGPPPRSKGNKAALVFFGLFILAFTGASGYLFGYQQGSSLSQKQHTAVKKPKIIFGKGSTQNTEFTKQTATASALTVPKLDPDLHWINESITASDSGLMSAEVALLKDTNNVMPVPFTKGTISLATGAASYKPDLFMVDNYYASALQKAGWVVPGSTTGDTYLTFRTFRLQSAQADTACGGIIGYLGYKDGMVRYVAINRSYLPCTPPSVKRVRAVRHAVVYTVFVSDPTPVQYFSDYLKAHAKK